MERALGVERAALEYSLAYAQTRELFKSRDSILDSPLGREAVFRATGYALIR